MTKEPEFIDELLADEPIDETKNSRTPKGLSPPIKSQEREPEGLDELLTSEDLETEAAPSNDFLSEESKVELEGFASGAIPFGLSTPIEIGLGLSTPENIRKRKEDMPYRHGLSAVAGLAASNLIPGVGAANVLGKIGQTGAAALGAQKLGKIGSVVINQAIQSAVYSAGDLQAQMWLYDPKTVMSHAVSEIGANALLGGLAGGVFGSVPPLWTAAKGTKTGQFLKALRGKVTGDIESPIALGVKEVKDLAERANIQVSPEMQAALSGNPFLTEIWQKLRSSRSGPALKSQAEMKSFYTTAKNAMLSALGKTRKNLIELKNVSSFDAGSKVVKAFSNELKARLAPLSDGYKKIEKLFEAAVFEPAEKSFIGDSVKQYAIDNEINLFKGSDMAKTIKKALEAIASPAFKTLKSFKHFQTELAHDVKKLQLGKQGTDLLELFKDIQKSVLMERLDRLPEALSAPGAINYKEFHADLNASYKAFKQSIQALQDKIKVPKVTPRTGPDTFIKLLSEMNPEDVLKKVLSLKDDAGFLNLIQNEFQTVTPFLKESYLNQILKASAKASAKNVGFSEKNLLASIDGMSPELRQFAIGAKAENEIRAAKSLIDRIPDLVNPSGTSQAWWEKLMDSLPAGLAMIYKMTGQNAAEGGVLGIIAKGLGHAGPDAMKRGILKFLGSDKPVSEGAFKSLLDWAEASIKGETLASHAVNALFDATATVLPSDKYPDFKDLEKLKTRLDQIEKDPNTLLKVGGEVSYYAPDHGAAAAAQAANIVQYLKAMKPNTSQMGPLGSKMEPSKAEEALYKRALMVAEQPLITMEWLKEGTLTPVDVVSLKAMYPENYMDLVNKITAEMIKVKGEGDVIKYQTKLSLARFLGLPLDNTMTPKAIQMTQPKPQQQEQTPQNLQGKSGGKSGLEKIGSNVQTPGQSREQVRQAR
jgi:hypothetical protein